MGFILGAKYENQYNIRINMIKGKKTHMIMSIDAEKDIWQNPTPFNDRQIKTTQQNPHS